MTENIFPSKPIRFLVMDVDGTLTDGGMYFSESGDEFKRFNTKDGMLISRLAGKNFPLAFLSSGLGKKMAQRRAEMLGVQRCFVGKKAKLEVLEEWRSELRLEWEDIGYIGDDINDEEVMRKVGFSGCPADAHVRVKSLADIVLVQRGGDGCAREFIDRFILEDGRQNWSSGK